MNRQAKSELPETENQVLRIITSNLKEGDEHMKIPRMLTINECAKEFAGTGLTGFRIRQLALNNEIVYLRAGKKILINVERLIDYLNTPQHQEEVAKYGSIRPVAMR